MNLPPLLAPLRWAWRGHDAPHDRRVVGQASCARDLGNYLHGTSSNDLL